MLVGESTSPEGTALLACTALEREENIAAPGGVHEIHKRENFRGAAQRDLDFANALILSGV
jgi:hypothetical protein